MTRETQDIYVFNGSPELRQQRDDLIGELMDWLVAKAESGALPIPLHRALLDVADFAAGHGEDAQEFWSEMRLKHTEARQAAKPYLKGALVPPPKES